MADEKPKTTHAPEANEGENKQPTDNSASVVGTGPATDTAETQMGEAVGLTEGEVKALRHDAGLNQLAGNQANTLAWAASREGREFAKTAKEREKAAKEEEKAYKAQFDSDGLTESEKAYIEASKKAHKG